MSIERDGGSAAAVDSGPTLASELGAIMGDWVPDAAPDSSSSPDAGAPPADASAASTDTNADPSEGSDADAARGDEPSPAASVAEPDPATPTPAEPDPLDGARPLSYTVNGEDRTFDGITLLKDGGAIVDPDKVELIQRRLGERDHLFEQSQAQFRKYADLERLTTWQTKDAQGNRTELTGLAALETHRATTADFASRLTTLWTAITDPQRFASMIQVVETGRQYSDGSPELTYAWKPDAKAALEREMTVNARAASLDARQSFRQLSAPQPAPEPAVADVAMRTVEATLKQANIASMAPEDKQFLAEQLERYVRPTTPQEQQQGLGKRIVDASFVKLVERTAKQAATVAKVAEDAPKIAKENQAKLAAAATAKRTTPKPAVQPKPQRPQVSPQRAENADAVWAAHESNSARVMRRLATG